MNLVDLLLLVFLGLVAVGIVMSTILGWVMLWTSRNDPPFDSAAFRKKHHLPDDWTSGAQE